MPSSTPVEVLASAGAPATSAAAEAAGLTLVLDQAAVRTDRGSSAPGPPIPVAGALPVPTAGPAEGSGARAPSPAGDPASGDRSAADPAPGADPVQALVGPAPTTPLTGVTGSGPAAPAGSGAPVAAQLGRQLAVLRNAPDGSQTMTVVLTPEHLGQVTVAVTITDGTLDLTLHGAHEAGRHALAEALPELRRELEGAGLSFNKVEVGTAGPDDGAGQRHAQQQLLDARAGQQGTGQDGTGQPGHREDRPSGWRSAPDRPGERGTAPTTDQSASPGVDVLA